MFDYVTTYSHAGLVLLASGLACAGGWIFGTGKLRRGLTLGALGVGTFLVDHWIFN